MSQGEVHLTRQDVVFGRALLAFGLVTRETLESCVAEYRALLAKNEKTNLAKVVVGRKLINAEQYQKLVQEMRKRFADSEQSEAAKALPDITRTGSFAAVKPAAPPGSVPAAQVQRAVEGFEESAEELIEDGSKMEVKAPPPPPLAPLPKGAAAKPTAAPKPAAAPKPEPAPKEPEPKAAPSLAAQLDWKKQLAGTSRHPSDAAIRKKLKVKQDEDTFDFGEYMGLSFLGAGAVGVVYKAKSPDGRTVALKAFAGAGSADKNLRRFLQERRVFQGLDHPAMVKVHDVGIQDDIPYFASDYVEGRTLADVLEKERPGRDVLVAVVARLAEAVAYLHDKGIILRDLKPENVMIRASDGHPVIVELGLAKDLGADLKLTVSGTLSTTPSFAAPEVQKDAAAATVASDVYTIGVLLYDATCGKLPFDSNNAIKLLEQIEKGPPAAPSSVDPTSPRALDAICLKALSREPSSRHATARALCSELEAALKASPSAKGAAKDASAGLFGKLRTKLFG